MSGVIALLLALGAGAAAQAAPVTAAPPATLDVLVADARGRPVDTLTDADFSVVERGVPLRVDSARFVPPRPPAPPPPSASPDGGSGEAAHVSQNSRLFGILLDEYHVSPGAPAGRARDALIRFVTEDLGPDDLVAIVKPLDSLVAITLTSDRSAIVNAIQGFDPRRGDYTPRTPFEKEFIAGAPSRIDAARDQIVVSSLNALATHLGQFDPARKTILLVTEGFAPRTMRRGDESLPGLSTAVLNANRAHVAIYALNPSADEPGPGNGVAGDGARELLRTLALETNGRATTSVADIGAVLKSALADATGYYVLTVSPGASDGRLHAVDVSVRRPELTVRARKGYWAPSDAELRPAVARGAPSFLSSFSSRIPRRSSPLILPWFGLSRDEAGTVRVSFVWEPAPRVPGDRMPGPVPARIALSVTTLDGVPVFDGFVLPANAPADSSGASRSRASFESPPGRLLVQMAIEDPTSRVVDRDVRDLLVGGFPGPVSLGTAEVLRARTAREQEALAADPDAVPVAARQFSRAERLLVRVPVFTTGATPRVSARLVSGLGGVMWSLPVGSTPSRPSLYQIDVPLAALAAGSYSIEVTAKTDEGDAEVSLPIRVTP